MTWKSISVASTIERMTMTDEQFSDFWYALGDVVRAALQLDKSPQPAPTPAAPAPDPAPRGEPEPPAAETPPARDTSSTTSALSERAWAPTHRAPAPVRAFGFGPSARVHACLSSCTDPSHSIPISDLCI